MRDWTPEIDQVQRENAGLNGVSVHYDGPDYDIDDLNARWHFTREGWVLEYDHPDGLWENRKVLFGPERFDEAVRETDAVNHERFEELALRTFHWDASFYPTGAIKQPYDRIICRGK